MLFDMMSKFLCIGFFVVAVTGQNQFIFPLPQLAQSESTIEGTYAIGESISIQWETTFSSTDLVIWQNGPNPLQDLPHSTGLSSTTTRYNWTIDISGNDLNPSFNLNNGAVFFFGLFQTGALSPYAQSQNINITAAAVVSSISSSSSSSRTSSASSTSGTSSASSPPTSSRSPTFLPSASASTTAAASSGGGLSSTAKTGLGVGIGIGVGFVALVAGIAIGYFLYRRKKAVAGRMRPVSEQPQDWVDHKTMDVVSMSPPLQKAPAEMHSTQHGAGAQIYEL